MSSSPRVVALLAVTALWEGSGRIDAVAPDSSTRDELQEFTELVATEFDKRGLELLPIVVREQALDDAYAQAEPVNDNNEVIDAGPITGCSISYDPDAVAWFEQSDDDPAALRAISAVAAHELVHCFEFAVTNDAGRAAWIPTWISDGVADWAAFTIVSPDSPAPPELSEWNQFFDPALDLYTRDPDAIGFWSAVERQGSADDVWQVFRYALTLGWERLATEEADSATATELSDAVLRRAAADPLFLARLAMSYLRRSEFGPEWETTGPGLGDERPAAAEPAVIGPGDEPLVHRGPVRGFAYIELQFADGVEVVRVTPRGYGALHWGPADQGPDDLFTGAAVDQVPRYYCLREDGCPCPSGSSRPEGQDVSIRPFHNATLVFFGDHETSGTSLQPQVEVVASPMADDAGQLCESDVILDFTVCDTWASHDELLALVPGGTSVTGPQDVGAPGGPFACLWTVVGPPLADPMFFEWTVDVWPFVALRNDQSAESWTAWMDQFDRDKGCTATRLGAEGPAACVGRQDDVMDVTVRLDADRFLWLHLESLDYPVPSFHSAGDQLALFFANRLAA